MNSIAYVDQFSCLDGLRVLVVDNNADCREFFRLVLESFSAVVKLAASAREALEVLRRWKPDVLISDIAMPDEDGYSLIRQIRILQQGVMQLPAIAITAWITDEGRAKAIDSGFSVYAEKPIDPDELAAVVAHLGGRKQMALVSQIYPSI